MPRESVRDRARPGSQTALRELNRGRIVEALQGGPLTQAQLARRTGLSAATVSNLVRALHDEHAVSLDATTSSGRRATSVRLVEDGRVVVGFDFGRRHARVVVVSTASRLVAERAVELPRGYPAMEGVAIAGETLDDLLAESGLDRSAVIGAGLGMPGPIDRRSGRIVQGTILPEWLGISADDLSTRLGLPVLLDNDANLGALAEVTWGDYRDVRNLVFIKIGSGIGSGLILDGRPYSGSTGVTGEIGHTSISEQGAVCQCGNRGCLETVASTTVMLELLYHRSPGEHSTDDIVRRALEGDNGTIRVIEDAAAAIGTALGNLANLVGPEVIVIGGPLAAVGDILLVPIARSLGRHTIPHVAESTTLAISSLGDRAEALGAATLALQQLVGARTGQTVTGS